MYDVRLKWYDLGLELDIPALKLDVIAQKNKNDHSDCLRDMLRVWLRFVDNPPTWDAIAKALTTKVIDELELANEGKLYTRVLCV